MAVETEIVWRGTVTQKMRDEFATSTRKNVQTFFRYFPRDLKIHLTLFQPKTGADHQRLILVRPLTQAFGQNPVGVPVIICTEGTQGVLGLMTIEGKKDKQVVDILAGGPYTKRPPREASEEIDESTLELSRDPGELLTTAVLCSNVETTTDKDVTVIMSQQASSKDVQVAESPPLSDVDLLQKVAGLLASRKQAQAELDRASSLEERLAGEVKELERLLEDKRAELAPVSADVEAAKMALSECSISDELREQARQAKARLDTAFTDL